MTEPKTRDEAADAAIVILWRQCAVTIRGATIYCGAAGGVTTSEEGA